MSIINNPNTGTIIDAFEKRVLSTPNEPAIIFKENTYSYFEVKNICHRISISLVQFGIVKGDTVGILISRSELFLMLPIAVTQIGAVFVPIDTNLPIGQINKIIHEAKLKLIITDLVGITIEAVPTFIITKQFLCTFKNQVVEKGALSLPSVYPDDLMCIFFTSGSTGTPKGVMHKHQSVYNMIVSDCIDNNTTNEDALLYYMNFGFLFGFRIFQSIIVGSPLHVASDEMLQDFHELNKYMEHNHITITIMPTQVACLFCSEVRNNSLRILEIGGSPIPNIGIEKNFEIYSAYGSTECLSAFNVVVDKSTTMGSIGRPNKHTEYKIIPIDKYHKKKCGELLVTGPGLSCGYLNDELRTREKFVSIEGKQYFRTGDLVKENDGGGLQFISRIDEMVKFHGLRVELTEIDSALMQYPAIKQVVTCVKSHGKSDYICAYYSTRNGRPISSKILKDFLANKIHAQKIPAFLIWQNRLPVSVRGKIDKDQLPMPAFFTTEYESPNGYIEKDVSSCYKKILKTENRIGRNDNFIDLGGDSLGQILLVGELNKLGYSLSFRNAIDYPVVKDLAAIITIRDKTNDVELDNIIVAGNSLLTNTLHNNDYSQINQFNINDLFKLRERVDLSVFRRTINELLEKHPMLRSIVTSDGLLIRPFSQDSLFSLDEVSVTDENENSVVQSNIRKLLNRKDVYSKGMLDLIVFHASNADYLYISCSHLVSDAISKKIIAEDISYIYDCLKNDYGKITFLEKNTYWQYNCNYNRLSHLPYCNNQKNYWSDIISLYIGTSLAGKQTIPNYHTCYSTATIKLNTEETLEVLQQGLIQEEIISAISNTIGSMFLVRQVPLGIIYHGRNIIHFDGDDKTNITFERTVGCFPYVYPILLELNGDSRIDTRAVIDTLGAVPDNGLCYDILSKSGDVPFVLPKFGFDYLGNNSDIIGKYSYLQRTSDFNLDVTPDITNQQIDCIIFAMVKNKRIRLCARYDSILFDKGFIERFLDIVKYNLTRHF